MRTLFIITVLLISASAFGQSNIEIGSGFGGAFQFTGDYRLEKMPGGWQDLNIAFSGYEGGRTVITAKIGNERENIFGYQVKAKGKTLYYYDMSKDGRIDTISEKFIPPFWIYFTSPSTNREKNLEFIKYCDALFTILQGKAGPEKDPGMKDLVAEIEKVKADPGLASRDMYYTLWYYMTYKDDFPFTCMTILNLLAGETERRYGKTHPLITYYRTVHQVKQGFNVNARVELENFLRTNPDFIPAKFLDYQIGKYSKNEKQKKLAVLKQNYPNHWCFDQLK